MARRIDRQPENRYTNIRQFHMHRLLWQMRDPVRKTDRTRILVLAEQGNRVKVPDTGQTAGLICSCENGVPALHVGGHVPRKRVIEALSRGGEKAGPAR